MNVAIVGGRLQGLEAVYLARKAGHPTLLIDPDPNALAADLATQHIAQPITDPGQLNSMLNGIDMVIPALENQAALDVLARWQASGATCPVAFDPQAYGITVSKRRSNQLFQDLQVPYPALWPHAQFPLICKPSRASGSKGVCIVTAMAQLAPFFQTGNDSEPIIQSFIKGPSYSLEVIGRPNHYRTYQITELGMDAGYDCKRVVAPAQIGDNLGRQFVELTRTLAQGLSLNGIMDVEIVVRDNQIYTLEIDARLPSQTPIAVYASTDVNLVDQLIDLFGGAGFAAGTDIDACRCAMVEHIAVSPDTLCVGGENLMSVPMPLTIIPDFYGADEAITNFSADKTHWVATLIITAADPQQLWQRRNQVIADMRRHFDLSQYSDPSPQPVKSFQESA